MCSGVYGQWPHWSLLSDTGPTTFAQFQYWTETVFSILFGIFEYPNWKGSIMLCTLTYIVWIIQNLNNLLHNIVDRMYMTAIIWQIIAVSELGYDLTFVSMWLWWTSLDNV